MSSWVPTKEQRAKYRLAWIEKKGIDKCREIWAKRAAQKRKENPELARAKNKDWRDRNALKLRAIRKSKAEKLNATARERYRSDPEKQHDRMLQRAFGISSSEYKKMIDSQHGLCAMCCRPETVVVHGKIKRLAVDHNHATGRIRALLCFRCNLMIGYAKEDISILESAISYLDHFNG